MNTTGNKDPMSPKLEPLQMLDIIAECIQCHPNERNDFACYVATLRQVVDTQQALLEELIGAQAALAMVYAGRTNWDGHLATLETVSAAMKSARAAIAAAKGGVA